jgi:hypothetical protein
LLFGLFSPLIKSCGFCIKRECAASGRNGKTRGVERTDMEITVRFTEDFKITGAGDNAAWSSAEWLTLPAVGPRTREYQTRAKLLWSSLGIYGFFDCEDSILTCTYTDADVFEEIYKEDVAEIFLWPDQSQGIYFEYEISPLGMELPLIVPNTGGEFHGWTPFLARGKRKIDSATKIWGGEKTPMAAAGRWTAEFFIPYALLIGLSNCPPKKNARWKGNLCRIDYDHGQVSYYSMSVETSNRFHTIDKYATFVFK